MPYTAVQAMTDDANPWGISEYFKIDYLPELPDDAIDALVDKAAEARSPFSAVFLGPLGGAVARTDRTTMALEVPDAKWFYFCEALWWDPAAADSGDRLGARLHGHDAALGRRTRRPRTSSAPTRARRGCAPPTASASTSGWRP